MKYEFEKNLHIIGDLLTYGRAMGAEEYEIGISETNKEMTVFRVKARPICMTQRELEKLSLNLNAPRQHEIEQNFWGLSGDSQSYSELALVGMMTDEAEVSFKNDELSIILKRYI